MLGGKAIKPNSNVLHRKLRSEPSGAEEHAVSPVKAARMGIARAGEKAFNLALRVTSIRQNRLDLADAVEQIEDEWALFPLKHDDGSVGIMCFEPACIVAFVERQTLGHVRNDATTKRRLTSTDKALAIAFLEMFLRLFDDALKDAPTAYWTRGYRPEDAVASRHLMVLQLEASEFRGFDVKCDVADVEHPLGMRLLLPIKEKGDPQAGRKNVAKLNAGQAVVKSGVSLQKAALSANVEMDAIMCKIMLPLSELGNLKPGHLVPLPQNAPQHAYLVDRVGRTEQAIHLGQLHGLRAVRLHQDKSSEPSALEPIINDQPSTMVATPTAAPEQDETQTQQAETITGNEAIDELDDLLHAT